MDIIPAIDIINGQCVRLTKGNFSQQTTYNLNPVTMAKKLEEAGIKRLHLVDLEGAKEGKLVNQWVLEEIAMNTSLSIDYSGGIKTDEDLEYIFSLGAEYVSIGSMTVKEPELVKRWLNTHKSKIIIGMDVENYEIKTNAWQQSAGISIFELMDDFSSYGLGTIICTDISKDGAMKGPSFELYQELMEVYPNIKIIASGGVSCLDDLRRLQALGLAGAITGKAIYEGKIPLEQLLKWDHKPCMD